MKITLMTRVINDGNASSHLHPLHFDNDDDDDDDDADNDDEGNAD